MVYVAEKVSLFWSSRCLRLFRDQHNRIFRKKTSFKISCEMQEIKENDRPLATELKRVGRYHNASRGDFCQDSTLLTEVSEVPVLANSRSTPPHFQRHGQISSGDALKIIFLLLLLMAWAWTMVELVQLQDTHNNMRSQYNILQKDLEVQRHEIAHLCTHLAEMNTQHAALEAKLKDLRVAYSELEKQDTMDDEIELDFSMKSIVRLLLDAMLNKKDKYHL